MPGRRSDHPDGFSGITFFRRLKAIVTMQVLAIQHGLLTSPLTKRHLKRGNEQADAGPPHEGLTHYIVTKIPLDFPERP